MFSTRGCTRPTIDTSRRRIRIHGRICRIFRIHGRICRIRIF